MTATTVVLMALLALLAGVWLTRPLWTGATPATLRRRRANVTAYETRVAEIDADLAAGALDAEAARLLRDEAAARLLHDAGDAAGGAPGSTIEAAVEAAPHKPLWAAFAAAVLLIGAGLAYGLAGGWRTRALIDLAQRDPQAAEQQMVDGMIAGLEARLRKTPDDAQGWATLGRAYVVTRRYADAATAYARANALSAEQPQAEWLVAAGTAQGLASADRDLRPSRPLFERALALDPGNAEALWYGGLAALQAGDMKVAYRHWLALRGRDLPTDITALLTQQLPLLAQQAGETLPPADASAASAPAAAASAGVRLTVDIDVDAALRAQIRPGMTLLVFAKAENGPPMPLAVQRISAPQFPLTVTLDDSMAMMPAMKLSGFERWIVTARLTSGAGAQALSGDLEGVHPASRAEAGTPLHLVIDRQLP
ncbi:MAG: c-type cytochrome biogenesis protein CcmI [Solimonas sp.]